MSDTATKICDSQQEVMRASPLSRLRRLYTAFFEMTTRKFSFALVDQAVVSATSFVTTILVGRLCGPEELAMYALGLTLMVLILSVLQTLIATPYTIYANRLYGDDLTEYRGAVLLQCGLLSVLAALLLVVWGTLTSTGLGPLGFAPVLYALSVAVPFCILREFARQFAFAHMKSEKALYLDLCTATLQVSGIIILSAEGLLSASTATLAIGAANAMVASVWLILSRGDFVLRRNQIFPAARRNLSFGGWILASRIASQLNSDILVLWLIVFVLGNKTTGIFAACMTVVHLSNPFVLGMGQVLTPFIAQAFAEKGLREVQQVARKTATFMGFVLSGFCFGAFLFGEEVLKIFYGGQYDGNSYTITVLSISILAFALSMPATSSLLALERPDVSLKASLVGLLLTLTVASALIFPLGILGVAWGLLSGQLGASAVRWIIFTSMVRKRRG